MKAINITKQDLVKTMSDSNKHKLALYCQIHNVSPEDFIDNMCEYINLYLNTGIEICNLYFESPAGKDYLEKRKEIEKIGMGMR